MKYLSGDELVPHLRLLRQQLAGSITEGKDVQHQTSIHRRLTQLPHVLGLTCYAVGEILECQNTAASELGTQMLRDYKPNNLAFQQLGPAHEVPILHAIDAFFDAARRTQNSLIYHLSLSLRRSLPSSLADLIKGIEAGTISCGAYLDQRLQEYWAGSGRRVKDYRDLAQHFAVVGSDAHVALTPDKEYAFTVFLPNNPEVKNATLLSFNPPVLAVEFIYRAFFELVEAVFDVTKDLVQHPLPRTRMMTMSFRALGTQTPLQRLITRTEWETDLDDFVQGLQKAKGVE